MTDIPAFGIYEELRHQRLEEILRRHPERRSVFGKLDPRGRAGSAGEIESW